MRSRWLSPRALLLHLTLILLVSVMVGLTWWQASRALSGNTLSYVYAFEWPLLAGAVVYMWWDLLHERPDQRTRREWRGSGVARRSTAGGASSELGEPVPRYRDDEDEDLAAYNRYLAELNASGRRKTWRHPT